MTYGGGRAGESPAHVLHTSASIARSPEYPIHHGAQPARALREGGGEVAYPGIASLYIGAVTFVGVLLGNTIGDTLVKHVDALRPEPDNRGELFLFQLGLNVIGGLLGLLAGLYSFNKLMRVTRNLEVVPLLDKILLLQNAQVL